MSACKYIAKTVPTTAILLGLLATSLAHAQTATQSVKTSAGDSGDQLTEIVVTAEKREATVQTTPISISAISGEDLQLRGLSDFASVAQSIPGISMRSDGPGQTEFEMRGMNASGGNSATVGFYLDDTPMTAPGTSFNGKVVIDPNLYDLSRVEVLRGPQGTLYGSGSMGGTIKLVTNAPNLEAFDASAEAIGSGTDGGGFNHTENAMVNLPFANGTAALRIVGTETHNSGWIDRVVIANGDFPLETNGNTTRGNVLAAPVAADYKNDNDEELRGVRASLLWQPTDRLSMTASGFQQTITQGGLNEIEVPPGGYALYQPFNVPQTFDDRLTLGSLTLKYQFDGFDLTSATSRWTRDEDIYFDASEALQWAFSTPTALFPFYASQGGIGANSPPSLEDDRTTQTSEEVRLASNTASNFQWLIGYFYQDFSSQTDLSILFPDAAPVFGTGNLITQVQPEKIIQNAFFGEASYQLTPSLKATVGLRRYSFDTSIETTVSGAISSTGSDASDTSNNGQRSQGVNPKINLSYEMNKQLLLYTTIAQGFRPGGANQPIPTSGSVGSACEAELMANHGTTEFVPAPSTFAPDKVWSYEIGEKFRTADSHVTVNSAVYFENWQNVQQEVALGCGFPYTDNTGEAHIYGSEVEINALLIPGLVLSANAGYTHAYFEIGSLEAGVAAGTPVQDIPEWTSSVSLAYQHRISDRLRLIGRIENDYVGGRTGVAYTVIELPAYDLTNIRIGIESETWSATLFAKNALNKEVLLSPSVAVAAYTSTFNPYTVAQPRTIGLDLNYRFGR